VGEHTTPNGRKFKKVECSCVCGKMTIVNLQDLRSKKTKTCGINHPQYTDRSLPAFNQLYRHTYKKRAIDKGLVFELTEEQFRHLNQQPCHYCGSPPVSNMIRTKSGKTFSEYSYNGVDRKDNLVGYTIENSVSCCGICNHSKHTMPYNEFIEWVSRVYNHTRDPNITSSF
jgi:hypothetical protein